MLAVPNFSAGRDRRAIDLIRGALARHANILDVHSDPVHDRSVFTVWSDSGGLPRG